MIPDDWDEPMPTEPAPWWEIALAVFIGLAIVALVIIAVVVATSRGFTRPPRKPSMVSVWIGIYTSTTDTVDGERVDRDLHVHHGHHLW